MSRWWRVKRRGDVSYYFDQDAFPRTVPHMLASGKMVEETLSPHDIAREVLGVFRMHPSVKLKSLSPIEVPQNLIHAGRQVRGVEVLVEGW